MEENVYNYYLEVQEDGNLYLVTEYANGYITEWSANATIECEGEVYFINLYED
jgi:hypothetical protein